MACRAGVIPFSLSSITADAPSASHRSLPSWGHSHGQPQFSGHLSSGSSFSRPATALRYRRAWRLCPVTNEGCGWLENTLDSAASGEALLIDLGQSYSPLSNILLNATTLATYSENY
jgi:hypothetical protein